MKVIRAFVGHSFAESDAAVVGKITKYLDQLAKLHPNFSWEHAEAAEPRVIDEKVLRLFASKNLFIGICTKKERVIAPGDLKDSFFSSHRFYARDEDIGWKTSDWIIQEIGLSLGRSLHVILLVEQGVRTPGELQGNLERIEFERDAPEKVFGKLLEMISALSPNVSVAATGEAESKASLPEDTQPPGDVWTTPKPEWRRSDYELAFRYFVLIGENDKAKSISDQYVHTEMGAQAQYRISWYAFTEYINLVHGKDGSLPRLIEFAAQDKGNCEIATYLARVYERYQETGKAALTYNKAAELAGEISDKLQMLGEAACAYQSSGNSNEVLAIVVKMRAMSASTGEGEVVVLKAERKLAEMAGEDDVLIATMERLLDLNPADIDTRFSLAYKYSNQGSNELAAMHYARIPYAERSPIAWNNLGVALDQIGLSAKSVDAYRKSEKMGETLAMSNLANKLIEAGFLSEAQLICDEALKLKDVHKNVGSTLSRLKGLPENEDKKESDVIKNVKPLSEFYKVFGRGIARPMQANLPNRWQGPDCILDFVFSGSGFSASGAYERAPLTGLVALASSGGHSAPTRFRIDYQGFVRGQAIVATVVRKNEGEKIKARTLLGGIEDGVKVLLVLRDDASEIQVCEHVSGGSPRFYSLKPS